jgi:hypothetical protein
MMIQRTVGAALLVYRQRKKRNREMMIQRTVGAALVVALLVYRKRKNGNEKRQ